MGIPVKRRLALDPRVFPGASRPLEVPVAPGLAFALPDDKGLVAVLVRHGAIAVRLRSPEVRSFTPGHTHEVPCRKPCPASLRKVPLYSPKKNS